MPFDELPTRYMILGVYWYFDFPFGLYSFDYFEFRKGFGGHADNPAELKTTIVAENPDKILEQLSSLVANHSDAFLFVYRDGNVLTIGTGSHHFFDFDFLLIKEVEKILRNNRVQLNTGAKLTDPKFLRLHNNQKELAYPSRGYFQVVGSPLRKYNAETIALRLDFNLDTVSKTAFLNDLDEVCDSANIEVLYYMENEFFEYTNLMLFLTNGRQGLNLQEKRRIDIEFLEVQAEVLFQKYNLHKGHKGGFESYPRNKPIVRKVVDREFVLDI